jgi:hypothetical protein
MAPPPFAASLRSDAKTWVSTADQNRRIPINQCEDAPPRLPSFAIWVAHRAISGKVKTGVEAAELFRLTRVLLARVTEKPGWRLGR